jgi:hypothetical protein
MPDVALPRGRAGLRDGLRYIARRVKPTRRHTKKLTEFEKRTGWHYQLIVTNVKDLGRSVPGSHHVFFLDTLHRQHAVVEGRVRTEKATGIRNLPFHGYERNKAWLLAANIAADLTAYPQLLGLEPDDGLATAETESLRATLLHIPARLTSHVRNRVLKIEQTRPWALTIIEARERLGAIPAPTRATHRPARRRNQQVNPAPAAPSTATPHSSSHTTRTNAAKRVPAPVSRTHNSRNDYGRRIEANNMDGGVNRNRSAR